MNADIQLLLTQQANGEISMNQAYNNATGEAKGSSFKDFLNKAVTNGWVDQAFNATSSILHSKYGAGAIGQQVIKETPCSEGFQKNENGVCEEVKKPISMGSKVFIGVGIVAVLGVISYAIYKNK